MAEPDLPAAPGTGTPGRPSPGAKHDDLRDVPRNDTGEDARVDAIIERGPGGAFAVAGVATAIVVAIYLAFYFFAYLPRGAVQ